MRSPLWVLLAWGPTVAAGPGELARFAIREPLGQTWTDEWLTREVAIERGDRVVRAGSLALVTADGVEVPAQFYRVPEGRLLGESDVLRGKATLRALFRATIPKGEEVVFRLTDRGRRPRPWPSVTVARRGSRTTIANGVFRIEVDADRPLPLDAIRCGSVRGTLGTFAWPEGREAIGVEDRWPERGPARAILRRTFRFADPALRYAMTIDVRAGDPWIDVTDEYALGRGTALTLDLRGLGARVVYHPHTYNARTFRPDGRAEDTTREPPQHPIATLGPIWRDIWFGGGPFAFVYRPGADHGLGIATVRGSQWRTPEGITSESQNLQVHGDREVEGRVRVRIPTDGGLRRWAIIPGPPQIRKRLGRLVRSHADIPLDRVLHDWILRWPSEAPEVEVGEAWQYLGSYYNRHFLNPTTFPRRVRARVDALLKKGRVRSRGLAALAYIFTDPNYWPGPRSGWKIGNPNFHTDMYNIPLKIALLMPDHPHARRWLDDGLRELHDNLVRDSYPGGAWAESLSYASYFFHLVEMGRLVRRAGIIDPFRAWPRFREVLTYLACMHTPKDPRYGGRQKAPIGDTSPGDYIAELRGAADLYRGIDDRFAEALARFPARWEGALDIGSREFPGFGAMLRGNPYDDRHESFVTIKAGPARNHYQGDELSFFFASLSTPLAIDHACHYSPRPWHAAMHNRPDMNGKRPLAVGAPCAFAASPAADVFVAEERATRVRRLPLLPHETTRPGWEYPSETLPADRPWTFRRYAMLVKHDPARSRIADYLVVRDEIASPEPVRWNLHVLARGIEGEGPVFRFPGQLGVDLAVHVLAPEVREIEKRRWGWRAIKGGLRRTLKGRAYEEANFGAYVPEDFEPGTWRGGEMAHWLRIRGPAGRTDWLVLLVPHRRGEPAPEVERISATCARVRLGDEAETIHLGSDGRFRAALERGGRRTVLLEAGRMERKERSR